MKGADVVMTSIVQYNDWLEEEVRRPQPPVPSTVSRHCDEHDMMLLLVETFAIESVVVDPESEQTHENLKTGCDKRKMVQLRQRLAEQTCQLKSHFVAPDGEHGSRGFANSGGREEDAHRRPVQRFRGELRAFPWPLLSATSQITSSRNG